MNDVTGMPQTAVVVGGSSELAFAVLRRLASRRLRSVLLAGPHLDGLKTVASQLLDLGVPSVETVTFDARDTRSHEEFADDVARRLGSIDLAIMAVGALGTSDLDELHSENVAGSLDVNFVGPAAVLTALARRMRIQGFGRIIVFSSVAGVRVRAANLVYGAAKAGLDGFCQGLGDALHGSGVHVMIVRPGYVRTKMTAGRPAPPFATDPDVVAVGVVRGLEHHSSVVWVPSVLQAVFAIFRLLPRPVWRRLPG